MNKELNTTIFLTSHDISDIEKLCKRVIIINDGKVVLNDSMSNLKYHYLNKKIIEAKLYQDIDISKLSGVTVVKKKGNAVRLEVDTSEIEVPKVIKALSIENIEDINISNIPLETIISDIYRKEKA